jgi:tetratricopeptide (TPR) repeat protein
MQWAIENFITQNGEKEVLRNSNFYGHGSFVKGWIYDKLLDYFNAAQAFEETRFKLIEKWGHKHYSIAEILNNLGNIYIKQGRYKDALHAYEEAKEINLSEFGKDHISVAGTLYNYGNLYKIPGRLDDSITALEEAKRICIKNYSENNSLIAEVWHSLGCVYLEQHDYIKAEEYLKKSLNININVRMYL